MFCLFSCLGLNNNNNNNVIPDSTLCLVYVWYTSGTDLLAAWLLVHRSGMSVLVTVLAGFWTT